MRGAWGGEKIIREGEEVGDGRVGGEADTLGVRREAGEGEGARPVGASAGGRALLWMVASRGAWPAEAAATCGCPCRATSTEALLVTSRKPRAVVVDGQLVIERPRRRRLGRAYLNLRLAAARGGVDAPGPMG